MIFSTMNPNCSPNCPLHSKDLGDPPRIVTELVTSKNVEIGAYCGQYINWEISRLTYE
jgi:hypothetical protein